MSKNPSWSYSTPVEFGLPERIAVTTPAAGAEWTQTVPANTIWLVTAIGMQLVTGAAVPNRNVRINHSIGGTARIA